jgi:hypothetical protein
MQKQYFDSFEQAIEAAWTTRLYNEFYGLSEKIKQVLGKGLTTPVFNLTRSETVLGSWNSEKKTLSLSYYLLDNYEWASVVDALKHEMAHMIVSEIWGDIEDTRVHGELFAKACNILEVSASRVLSNDNLIAKEKVVSKIQRLFALGESNFQAEAKVAVQKAYELMAKHNIDSIHNTDRKFVFRPVGEMYGNIPYYVRILGSLVADNYFVRAIFKQVYNVVTKQYQTYLEIYGEPHNVDVAEYVYHFLLHEGEREWKAFYARTAKAERKRFSKNAFLEGFYSGFRLALKEERGQVMTALDPYNTLPIGINDPLLEKKFSQTYPNSRTQKRSSGTTKMGRSAGAEKGKQVKVRQGVSQNKGSKLFLS